MPASISRKNSSKSATASRLDGIFSRPLSGADGGAGDCTKVRGRLVTPVTTVRNRMASTPGYGHGCLQPDICRGGSVVFMSVPYATIDRQRNHIADDLENYSKIFLVYYSPSNFDDLK